MGTNAFDNQIIEKIKEQSTLFQHVEQELSKVIVGNKQAIKHIQMALLSQGHILLEGLPGIAKTTLIKAFDKALGLQFSRIQFTPDLLPSDLIGTLVYNPKTQEFETRKGPLFANLVLADEINRSPAKVQAALLEAMQEKQVTIGSNTYRLEEPFLVFATQNPVEQEGTYQLPEAQVDRFLFKLLMGYPNKTEELQILNSCLDTSTLNMVLSPAQLKESQKLVQTIYIDEKIKHYIVSLVFATRNPEEYNLAEIQPFILYGVSPRASLALQKTAQAHAFLQKRHFVTPDDVKAVAPAVLRHRLILSYEAEAENISSDSLIEKLLATVPTP